MNWFGRNPGIIVGLTATVIVGIVNALTQCGRLDSLATAFGSSFGAWDVVLLSVQDPYIVSYFLWPLLTVIVAYRISRSAHPAMLLRHGSHTKYLLSETIHAMTVGVVLTLGSVVSSLTGTSGLDWEPSWSQIALGGNEVLPSLYIQAAKGLAIVPVLITQIFYVMLTSGLLAAGLSILILSARTYFRVLVIAISVSMPVIFKAWPFAQETNPIGLLVTSHALVGGFELWAAPLIDVLILLAFLTVAYMHDRNINVLIIAHKVERRWPLYVIILIASFLLMVPVLDRDTSFGQQILVGASKDSFVFISWAFSVILWMGLVFVQLLRWSTVLTERLPYLVLRYGRSGRLILRETLRDVATSCVFVCVLLVVISCVDAATGRPHLALADVLHLLVVGPSMTTSIIWFSVIVSLLAGSVVPMTVSLVGGVVLSIPIINPLWPWPSATVFLGSRVTESLSVIVLLASVTITVIVYGALVTVASTRRVLIK